MRRVAAAVVAVTLLAGCGSSHRRPGPSPSPSPAAPTPAPAPPSDEALIGHRLALRAARMQAAPRARPLGIRRVRLELVRADVHGSRATVTARLTYGIRGVRGEFGGTRTLRATRRAGHWRLGPARGTRDRAPWEADAYRRVPTRHFVIWMPAGLDPGPLPAALEDGYARMRGALDEGTLKRRYLVVVARDTATARRITRRIRGLGGLTALTDTQVRQTGASERVVGVASQRLLVVWPAFLALDAELQRVTVAHELTHAALAPVTSGRVPGWLGEGVAMYVSGDRRTIETGQLLAAASRVPSLRSLSRPTALARLDGAAQSAAYAYASAAAFYIADRYGRRRLMALYDAFNRDDVAGSEGDPATVDAATRKVLHVSLATLDRRVRAAASP